MAISWGVLIGNDGSAKYVIGFGFVIAAAIMPVVTVGGVMAMTASASVLFIGLNNLPSGPKAKLVK